MTASSPRPPLQDIVVVGAGVIGLTTATLLQERIQSKADTTITIVATEFPTTSPMQQSSTLQSGIPTASYASMWAGAHYRPIPCLQRTDSAYSTLTSTQQKFHSQLSQEREVALRTAEIMKQLAKSNHEAGVQIVKGVEYLENPPAENVKLRSGDIYASSDDGFRVLSQNELDTLNTQLENANSEATGEVKWACEYSTYVVNVHIYCAYLLSKFLSRGGKIVQRCLNHISEAIDILPAPSQRSNSSKDRTPIIVNCSGIGISHDPLTKIIRGQTILVRNPFPCTMTRQCADGTWCFLIPRPLGGGTIVGGTKQISDPEVNPRPEERRKLLENAVRYFPEFVGDVNEFQVVGDNVGQRPWREGGMRIEIETEDEAVGGRAKVIHGYGAGGRGYELSWGAAEKICFLVDECLEKECCARTAKL